MNTKIVYQTDPNGVYTHDTTADESPLERYVYHIPAGAVEVAPPKTNNGEQAVWVGTGWIVQPIPTTTPEPLPTASPELLPAEKITNRRLTLLQQSDWTQGRDIPDATALAWQPYRQALRDITEQTGFPLNVVWPDTPIQG